MSICEWSEEYKINIPRFDAEHRMLLGLLNELLDITEIPEFLMYQVVMGKLEDMRVVIKQHFSSEECFMADNGYPEELLEEQRQKHLELLGDLENFMAGYKQANSLLARDRVIFITDWLIRHIIIYDKKMGDYFCRQPGQVYC